MYMNTPLDATQVGIGSTPIEVGAWIVLIGGIVLAALWVRSLSA